ncbi:MAG: hypothetical protein Q7V32_07675 [Methylicorpusculum sp.]|nr:hypothetical protein [Methylicorpusculum sp.]
MHIDISDGYPDQKSARSRLFIQSVNVFKTTLHVNSSNSQLDLFGIILGWKSLLRNAVKPFHGDLTAASLLPTYIAGLIIINSIYYATFTTRHRIMLSSNKAQSLFFAESKFHFYLKSTYFIQQAS